MTTIFVLLHWNIIKIKSNTHLLLGTVIFTTHQTSRNTFLNYNLFSSHTESFINGSKLVFT
jgi:hypothetical protein